MQRSNSCPICRKDIHSPSLAFDKTLDQISKLLDTTILQCEKLDKLIGNSQLTRLQYEKVMCTFSKLDTITSRIKSMLPIQGFENLLLEYIQQLMDDIGTNNFFIQE